ncbi:uncharacterized protein LOC109824255 isoform X2 [Asparagus officinalis]|uniref:uncharacterized protein LOC109824255 isoform X2 n=1 Tax=Asparagus officinalis TaxID=4686 RepID=UPI00098E4F62|nr:uncharacterized protein LOC109824255 isoform X2 [Asparagus officinalis]
MDRTRERKMSFSSSRRRSRGMVPKESSGIWKVENEGIDTIRERYRIKDHRLNGRTRHSRLVSNESSDESFDEEMAGGQNGQAVIKDTKLKGYDEIIVGVPVPRRARGLKRRLQNSVVNAQSSNVSKETGDEAVPISETEVEVAKVLFGLTKLHSQDSDAVVDTFQGSSVPDTSALPKGSKGKKFKPLQSDDDEKPSMIITSNSKSDVTIDQLNAGSSVPFPSMNGKLAGISSTIEKVTTSSTKLDKSSSNNSGQSTVETPLLGPQNVVSPTVLAEEKPSPASSIMSQPFMSAIHPGQAKPLLLNKGDEDSNANCKTEHEQSEQLTGKGLDRRKQDLPPQSCQNKNLDRHKGASPVSSVKDCVKKMKYEIDLMALPHGDEVDAINECDPQVSYINQGTSNDENICKRDASRLSCELEIEDSKSNQNTGVLHEFHKKEVTKEGMENQPLIEGKSGSCQDRDNADKMVAKKHSQKIVKDISLPSGRAGLINNNIAAKSTLFSIPLPCSLDAIRPYGSPSTGSASLCVVPAFKTVTLWKGIP